jgi:hypothetical protein
VTGSLSPQPGRSCPLSYRYAPASLARAPELVAETLYVIGGLYGNRQALEWVEARAAREHGDVALVFNGDLNWFNVDPESFAAVNDVALRHVALRGNVETEISGEDPSAGCGCGYPESVDDAEVDRSNRIIERLRGTARVFPALRQRLAALPMHLVAEVGGLRVAVVHGDAESLAGWGFSQEALADAAHCAKIVPWFEQALADVFACSHTCLPVGADLALPPPRRRGVVINNGAAGMPNFRGTRYGVITRISRSASREALYGFELDGVRIEALAVRYDHGRWLADFDRLWPAGSPAAASYRGRIVSGPGYELHQAARFRSGRPAAA